MVSISLLLYEGNPKLKKNYSLDPMVLTRNFCLILFNFYCFFAIDSFFILKCACLGASKYLIYIRNDVFQQSATCKIRNFLSIRLNNSDPLGDTKTSKFSPYNFSQYNFRKLIRPWSAQFTNLFLKMQYTNSMPHSSKC